MKSLTISSLLCLTACACAQSGSGTTNYIGARVEWKWTIESKAEGPKLPLFSCDTICQGKKHSKHETCDLSCDTPCALSEQRGNHLVFLDPQTEDLGEKDEKPKKPNIQSIGEAFTAFGMPTMANASVVLRSVSRSALTSTGSRYVATVEKSCWNKTPCSSSTMFVNSIRLVVKFEYQLLAIENQKVVDQSPVRSLRMAVISVPKEADRVFSPSEPTVSCKCEVKQEPPKETGFIPGYINQDEYAYCESEGTKRVATGEMISQMVPSIAVQNMNRAIFTVAPGHGTCFIPAGWELECTSGGGQNVQLQEDLVIQVLPWPQKIEAFLAPITLRTLCLQIDKPEPNPNMTYRFVPPSRPSLMRLARGVRASNFRGPWDQMRLWIATDYATYAKIRDVLLPTPSRRTYLYELYVAAQALTFSPFDKRAESMMETALLAEPQNDLAAASWLLRMNLARNAKATADALKSNAQKFHPLFSDPKFSEYMANLAEVASQADDEHSARAAVRLLTDCVPAEKRAEVASHDGAWQVGAMLMTTEDPKVATVVLDYLEAFKPPCTTMACMNVSPALPQQIKDRAAKLIAGKSLPSH